VSLSQVSAEEYFVAGLRELHQLCKATIEDGFSIIEAARAIPDLVKRLQLNDKVDLKAFIVIESETDELPVGRFRELWDIEALNKLEPEIESAENWARMIGLAEINNILNVTGRTKFAASHPDARTVQAVLGSDFQVIEFLASTKTSADAAAAVGCSVGQIAKSIVFKTVKDQRPVLVIASGINRVDEKKVSAVLGEKVKSADAEFVMANAGVAPGGVPPVGHVVEPVVVLDQDLRQYTDIWAAAGTPNAVFKLTWDDLVALTKGTPADVAKVQPVLP
jgi:prolyl-tRNA editing enzyme YbaK/EbsC (Cys-tRNA(Pro) deacylase)